MAFVTKTWKDRLVEYAGRRKLKNVATGEEVLMDVSRSEGTVSQAGDAFSAANMNNLEQRIKKEFDTVNSSLNDSSSGESFNFGSLNGVRGFFTNPSKADDSFVPFRQKINSVSTILATGNIVNQNGVTYNKTITFSKKGIAYISVMNAQAYGTRYITIKLNGTQIAYKTNIEMAVDVNANDVLNIMFYYGSANVTVYFIT